MRSSNLLSMAWTRKVKFHRVVEMGRCPVCLLQHKCRTAESPVARTVWQRLACRHQWLQRAQKTAYALDRATAARDYPLTCLYFAMDGGSGHDYVFPHLAGAAIEGPSKAVAKCATNCLKVMNALIHGDSRSHVILSPGTIVAGASHTCESIMVVLNGAFQDHGDIPPNICLQLDNASNNHNILVLAFAALYVLDDVCETFKVRFELDNHAHDIYDAFTAIHNRAVRKATFFMWEELRQIVQCSHRSRIGCTRGPQPNSLMGHDVKVSNMWNVRDIWEWLAPGYHANSSLALSQGAFVCYDRLSAWHDFLIKKEDCNSVGLWAKQYMSDHSDKFIYVGTLTNRKMVNAVVGDRRPSQAADTARPQKVEHESQSLKELQRVARGPYKEQFTADRLADAMAISRRDWNHFASIEGNLPPVLQMLPAELAEALRRAGKRAVGQIWGSPGVLGRADQALQRAASTASLMGGGCPPKVPRQFTHIFGDLTGARRGEHVPVVARYGTQPRSDSEFAAQPAGLGGFVATRCFLSSPLARLSPRLQTETEWIWRVIRTYQIGDQLDTPVAGETVATEVCYEAHLYSRGLLKFFLIFF